MTSSFHQFVHIRPIKIMHFVENQSFYVPSLIFMISNINIIILNN